MSRVSNVYSDDKYNQKWVRTSGIIQCMNTGLDKYGEMIKSTVRLKITRPGRHSTTPLSVRSGYDKENRARI